MIFSKKNHELIQQNEKIVKKPQKHDANLQKNSTLYFQVGLIICLLLAYGVLEMKFDTSTQNYALIEIEDDQEFYYDLNSIVEEKPEVKEVAKKKIKPKHIINPKFIPVDKEIVNPINYSIEPPTVDSPVKIKDIILAPKPRGPISIIGVEKVPIYPGCESAKTNDERRQCMSNKIAKHIQKKFNTDIASQLGLTGSLKIDVMFKIDKFGNTSIIETRAPHKKLENEARRVVHKIPKMIPGKQSNKNVEVLYNLPIRFNIQN